MAEDARLSSYSDIFVLWCENGQNENKWLIKCPQCFCFVLFFFFQVNHLNNLCDCGRMDDPHLFRSSVVTRFGFFVNGPRTSCLSLASSWWW